MKSRNPMWENIVLLTASNEGFHAILQNWEYLAGQQHLRWAVGALDESVYKRLGKSRSFLTDSNSSLKDVAVFRDPGFNIITCKKLDIVKMILECCKLDVVFADPDAVFLKDPFSHDLGSLIRSQKYDYIYQLNYGNADKPNHHIEMGNGSNRKKKSITEGNTGFHYLSHKSRTLKQLLRHTILRCRSENNEFDDQTLFWDQLRKKTPFRICHESKNDTDWVYKDERSENIVREGGEILSMCYLDPYFYRVGKPKPKPHMKNDTVVFHANFVVGKEEKIRSLRRQTLNSYGWDDSRISVNRIR